LQTQQKKIESIRFDRCNKTSSKWAHSNDVGAGDASASPNKNFFGKWLDLGEIWQNSGEIWTKLKRNLGKFDYILANSTSCIPKNIQSPTTLAHPLVCNWKDINNKLRKSYSSRNQHYTPNHRAQQPTRVYPFSSKSFMGFRKNIKNFPSFFRLSLQILRSSIETFRLNTLRVVCTNVGPTVIADQRNFKAKYLQNCAEENWIKNHILLYISFSLLQHHVIFHLYWFT